MPAKIVITGGPGSGKTESLARLKDIPRYRKFVFLSELARKLLEEFPHYRHDITAFHKEIYRQQTERETKLGEQSFMTDRGTADAFAFHPETMSLVNTTLEAEYRRYSSVVQLGSAAALGEEYAQYRESTPMFIPQLTNTNTNRIDSATQSTEAA